MNPVPVQRRFTDSSGYTLVEALVAGALLMMAISAASTLTLTILTQEEMSQRHGVAVTHAEAIAGLYQLGLDETSIRQVLPDTPIVEQYTLTTGSAPVAGVGDFSSAQISVRYNPSPATESWTGRLWTAGQQADSRTIELRAYRASQP